MTDRHPRHGRPQPIGREKEYLPRQRQSSAHSFPDELASSRLCQGHRNHLAARGRALAGLLKKTFPIRRTTGQAPVYSGRLTSAVNC